MQRKINVLQLVEGFGLGGAEKKLVELIRFMDKDRFRTVVCGLGLVKDEIREDFDSLDVKILVEKRKHKVDFGLILRLARLMKEEEIDVVMTTLFYADVIGPLAGKYAGVKAVFSWETISSPEWLLKHKLYPYRFAIRYCKKVVSVSQATAKFLIEERGVPPEKVCVIPYGVNLEQYKPTDGKVIREKLGIPADDPVIGMVGRLHPQKGHIFLLEAAETVVKEFPNCKFVIVGDGPLRSDLEKMVTDKNLTQNVIFLGFRDDVNQVLHAFDIFTLPSLYEGLPNVVLEAMASGLPIIASTVDGTKEAVVHEDSGLLMEPKDTATLTKYYLNLLKNSRRAKQMGRNARKRVEDHFSLQLQVQNFENLYSEYVN